MEKTRKIRIVIDICMAALLLLLLNSAVTGVLLHEILGVAITVLFIAHLIVNRKWIAGITRSFKDVKTKVRAAYIFDAVIALSTALSVISGMLISKFLFSELAAKTGLWYEIHVVASYLAFFLILLHAALHAGWIRGTMQAFAKRGARAKAVACGGVIGLISAAAVYSLAANDSLNRLLSLSGKGGTGTKTVQTDGNTGNFWFVSEDNTSVDNTSVSATPAAKEQVTLQEFLSKLYCTGCGRHCPLTNPRCQTGVEQAKEQTAVYNAQYGQE